MYVPSTFSETRAEILQQLIREYPLGALVTLGSEGLSANHIPFEIDPEPAPFGTLRGHVARADPLWRDLSPDVEPLAIFQGPRAYITPSWYPSGKEGGKVVPTYNYIVVHAYGPMRVIEDREWLRDLLERLTNQYEAGRQEPWRLADAPGDFLEKLLPQIVGIEIPITRLVGKWKVSQNRSPEDRAGVVEGLGEAGGSDASAMAEWVDRCGG